MSFCYSRLGVSLLLAIAFVPALLAQAQPSPGKHSKPTVPATSGLDPGTITNNVYRNQTLGFAYKIPDGWVLRTDDLNAPPAKSEAKPETPPAGAKDTPASSAGSKVLLAAFSRPPEAKGEEINSSVLIVAESVANYPGLEEAAQYFYPLEEVAKAQGLVLEENPYAIAIDNTTLVRGDFHKDVGTRIMRQSTLVVLEHGYAVSITLIAGTEDDVEGLIDALNFTVVQKNTTPKK